MKIILVYISFLISVTFCTTLRKINVGSYLNQHNLLERKGTYFKTNKDGGYIFRTEQDNGSIRFERGSFQYIDGERLFVQQGFFAIKQANGYWFSESYVADPVNGNRVIHSRYSNDRPQFDQGFFTELIENVIPFPAVKKNKKKIKNMA